MSDRHKPHNGRGNDGGFRVKKADVDDKIESPDGEALIRDDVRLGGAVADIGPHAGERAAHIGDLVEQNRADVARATGQDRKNGKH